MVKNPVTQFSLTLKLAKRFRWQHWCMKSEKKSRNVLHLPSEPLKYPSLPCATSRSKVSGFLGGEGEAVLVLLFSTSTTLLRQFMGPVGTEVRRQTNQPWSQAARWHPASSPWFPCKALQKERNSKSPCPPATAQSWRPHPFGHQAGQTPAAENAFSGSSLRHRLGAQRLGVRLPMQGTRVPTAPPSPALLGEARGRNSEIQSTIKHPRGSRIEFHLPAYLMGGPRSSQTPVAAAGLERCLLGVLRPVLRGQLPRRGCRPDSLFRRKGSLVEPRHLPRACEKAPGPRSAWSTGLPGRGGGAQPSWRRPLSGPLQHIRRAISISLALRSEMFSSNICREFPPDHVSQDEKPFQPREQSVHGLFHLLHLTSVLEVSKEILRARRLNGITCTVGPAPEAAGANHQSPSLEAPPPASCVPRGLVKNETTLSQQSGEKFKFYRAKSKRKVLPVKCGLVWIPDPTQGAAVNTFS